MGDEHVDHPVLQHLERADSGAELLSRLGVFQRRRIQLGYRADGIGTKRTDGSITAGLERDHTLTFPAQQLTMNAAQAHFGGTTAVDGLEALQMQIGSAPIDDE